MNTGIKLLLLTSFFIATLRDIQTREIPNIVHILLLISGTIHIISGQATWQQAGISLIVTAAVGLLLAYFDLLGSGDAKMIAAASPYFGIRITLDVVLIATLLLGLSLLVLRCFGKYSKEKIIPFAPFLTIGYMIAIFI